MVDFNSKENWPQQPSHNKTAQSDANRYQNVDKGTLIKLSKWILNNTPTHFVDHACAQCVSDGEIVKPGFVWAVHTAERIIKDYKLQQNPDPPIKVSVFVQIKPGPLSSVHFGTTLFKDGEPIGKILSAERVGDVVTGKVKIDDVKPTLEETASAYKFFGAIDISLQPSPESLKIIEALSKKIAEDVSGRLFNETTLDDIIKGVHETMSKSWMRKALPPEQSGITGHMTMSRKSFYVTHLDAAIKGANHAITGAKYDGNYLNDNATIAYDDAYKAVIALIISPSSMNDVMLEAVYQYVVKGRSFYRDIFLQMLKDYAASKYIEGRLEF